MADESTDTRGIQTLQAFDQPELGAQAAIRAIVDVTDDQQRIGLLSDRKVDNALEGFKGGIISQFGNSPGYPTDSTKLTIKVQICCVDETDQTHTKSYAANSTYTLPHDDTI